MTKPRILVFSFEGMNRSGKSTQTSILKSYLENERKIPTFILRGEGRRTEIDEDNHFKIDSTFGMKTKTTFWDHFKLGWKLNTDSNKKKKIWNEATNQLEKEFEYFKVKTLPEILKRRKNKFAIVLLDRGLISRYYREIQHEPKRKFKKTFNKSKMQSKHYFVLNVPLDDLLKRLSVDKSEKSPFRKKMLKENYLFFAPAVTKAKYFLSDDEVTLIDGKDSIENIHNRIKTTVDKYIEHFLK